MPASRCVHLVAHEESVRASLVRIIESLDYRVQTYRSGGAFLGALADILPGCVMLNIHMPEIDGLEVQRRMNAAGSGLPVIVLDGDDLPCAVAAMKLGAVEYLVRPYSQEAVQAALEEGFSRLESHRAADAVAEAARNAIARLTPRELDVLLAMLTGSPNKEIARDLAISPRTVELHRANLMDKVGARGLSGVIRIALDAGLDLAA